MKLKGFKLSTSMQAFTLDIPARKVKVGDIFGGFFHDERYKVIAKDNKSNKVYVIKIMV